jgi:hypothetical protein
MGLLASSCDSTAKFVIKNIQYDSTGLLSTFPAQSTANGFERVCRGPASGMELGFNLVSTQRVQSGVEVKKDLDLSIRPGDQVEIANDRITVNDGGNVAFSDFEMNIDCIKNYPDSELIAGGCTGGVSSGVNSPVEQLIYKANNSGRDDHASVAIIIDNSGSMVGFVNPTDMKEDTQANSVGDGNLDLLAQASDYLDYRIQAVEGFIDKLNDNDELIVYEFNEDRVRVACSQDAPSEEARAEACFGVNRDFYKNYLRDSLRGNSKGRSPLWKAVGTAWDFMKNHGTSNAKHIIVVTDSPDTCALSSYAFRRDVGNSACGGGVGYNEVLNAVEIEWEDNPIKISFVQFQSVGYRDHDPQQWEMACQTDGQYLFVNSQDLSGGQGERKEPLETAFLKLRYALEGSWRSYIGLSVLAVDSAPPLGLPVGAMYAIGGTFRFKLPSDLTTFSVTGREDKRLVLRKPCAVASDCSTEADDGCTISCGTDTGGYSGTWICTDNATDVVNKVAEIHAPGEFYQQPDSAPCLTDSNSICCAGSCATSLGASCVGSACCEGP